MAISKKQNIVSRMLVDKSFRQRLLRDPRKAAREAGLVLSEKAEAAFLDSADRIKEIGRDVDRLMDLKGFIPFSTGGGKSESRRDTVLRGGTAARRKKRK